MKLLTLSHQILATKHCHYVHERIIETVVPVLLKPGYLFVCAFDTEEFLLEKEDKRLIGRFDVLWIGERGPWMIDVIVHGNFSAFLNDFLSNIVVVVVEFCYQVIHDK